MQRLFGDTTKQLNSPEVDKMRQKVRNFTT